ncbi:flavodoxin family protein [Candidatus Formimonas warabiya]|uniref:NADPH-dependent FMN reductase-like domain-containing protein n=1 Tax=Formimonas warabiya TaxID=1761012 RepID=A0A3G1KQL1_FORW1|nr:flavodoxin family protein [Candidatus Formimonas warabiya]ATW24759.1 hypothetical protein DCMF_08215 [Candidatus Formimonas warabiya]
MKVLSIVSSYRRNGNTDRIVKLVEEQVLFIANLQNIPLELEKVSLGSFDIQTCHGCRICFDKGETKCPLKDELLPIRDKILQADGIITASPVYVEDVNGIMKNWIDRMAFNCHRPAFVGKPAVVITTSGMGSSNHALNTISTALSTWGCHIVSRSKFRTGALMKIDEINARYHHRIKKIAAKLFHAIMDKEVLKPSFYSLVVFRVQQKYWQKAVGQHDLFDFVYWGNKGWLEPHCEFYIPHKASRIKVNLARLIGDFISRFLYKVL